MSQSLYEKRSSSFEDFFLNEWKVMSYGHRIELIIPKKYQWQITRLIPKTKEILINSARKVGVTTMLTAYSAWMMLFRPNTKVVVTSVSKIIGKEFIDLLMYSFNKLPIFAIVESQTPFFIELKNGSKLYIIGPSEEIPEDEIDLAIIENADFVTTLKETQQRLKDKLKPKGCLVTASTLYHKSEFLEQCAAAREGEFEGQYIEIPSNISKQRTEKWFNKKASKKGKEKAKVEAHSCYYIEDGTLQHINNFEL